MILRWSMVWIFLSIVLIIITISFVTFEIAFRRTKKVWEFPDRECYNKYKEEVLKAKEKLENSECEEIYITSFDKTKLFGRFYEIGDSKKIDICFHGYRSEARRDFCGAIETSEKTNHSLLLVDERAHGKSEGKFITFGIKERRDGLAWINYVINRFGCDVQIYLYGISMGAATILMMSALDLPENVKIIVADSPYSSPKEIIKKTIKDMHLPANIAYPFVYFGARIFGGFNIHESSASEAVKKSKIPILIFHGTSDYFVPYEMSEEIFKNINSKKEILLTPNADHGMSYMVNKEKYYETLINFMKKNI